jgi:predicted nucleic acid-binding protein
VNAPESGEVKKRAGESIVLDAWAIMAYLNEEPAAQQVRRTLRQGRSGDVRLLLSIINYGECLYNIERNRGLRQAQLAIAVIDALPLEILAADRPMVFTAARIKAGCSISFADAFAAAAAKLYSATLMTGDPEFQALEQQIKIHWLAR